MHHLQQRLLHDFYQIESFSETGAGACAAVLSLNARHPILEGHFPGFPVVPGVCMMQMTKELLEHAIGRKTRLVSARSLKFLNILNPNENKTVRSELTYHETESGQIEAESRLLDPESGTVFFKMKGTFCLQ